MLRERVAFFPARFSALIRFHRLHWLAFALIGMPWALYTWLVAKTSTIELRGGNKRPEAVHRRLFLSWHQNHTLLAAASLASPEARHLIWIGHQKPSAMFFLAPAVIMGLRGFVFQIPSVVAPARQIGEVFLHGPEALLLPDSGGPYFSLKPGALRIAHYADCELVSLRVDCDRTLTLGKILRHRIPLPFSRIIVNASPIAISSDDQADTRRTEAALGFAQ